tara:strand:+ start:492 stop:1106 length:615 start_codon:yes stop_codon:yes gene_type:complete
MRKIITSLALTCSLFMAPPAFAAQGGKMKSNQSVLTQTEIANLQFMREEEKLARDVYLTLDQYWGNLTSVFANIAVSEESHTSTINYLLEKYDIEDPVISNEVGVFTNPELQELFHTLVEKGIASFIDGLYVGALIEEVDMEDIVAAIDATDERAMILAYSNLLDGSKSHLRGFVSVIESQGLVYEAQVLNADEVQLILESEDH